MIEGQYDRNSHCGSRLFSLVCQHMTQKGNSTVSNDLENQAWSIPDLIETLLTNS